jgi:hypothetical protein
MLRCEFTASIPGFVGRDLHMEMGASSCGESQQLTGASKCTTPVGQAHALMQVLRRMRGRQHNNWVYCLLMTQQMHRAVGTIKVAPPLLASPASLRIEARCGPVGRDT